MSIFLLWFDMIWYVIIYPLMLLLDLFPKIPEDAYQNLIVFLHTIFDNISFLGYFIPLPLLFTTLWILLSVEVGFFSYYIILWVYKKIPLVGAS